MHHDTEWMRYQMCHFGCWKWFILINLIKFCLCPQNFIESLQSAEKSFGNSSFPFKLCDFSIKFLVIISAFPNDQYRSTKMYERVEKKIKKWSRKFGFQAYFEVNFKKFNLESSISSKLMLLRLLSMANKLKHLIRSITFVPSTEYHACVWVAFTRQM